MSRKTYKIKLTVLIQVDDEITSTVKGRVQEHVNDMYHKMERESDIRVVLQQKLEAQELE